MCLFGTVNINKAILHDTNVIFALHFAFQISFEGFIMLLKELKANNMGFQFFRALDPILWALNEDNAHFDTFLAPLTLTKLSLLIKTVLLPCI